jgi:thiamine kinase-like enzyme
MRGEADMSSTRRSENLNPVGIVLVCPEQAVVLAERKNGTLQIPRLMITSDGRFADALGREMRACWSISPVLIDILKTDETSNGCVVCELQPAHVELMGSNFVRCSYDDLGITGLTTAEQTALMDLICRPPSLKKPFARFGWVNEAEEWISSNVSQNHCFSDDVLQSHAGACFALVRIATVSGSSYWLKATSFPNAHEMSVTRYLSEQFPEYLPRFIASRSDWNAWVTEDSGVPLKSRTNLETLTKAAMVLARLQTSSIGKVPELLNVGCFDQRVHVLRGQLPRLIQYLQEIMAAQTSTRTAPLTFDELNSLGTSLDAACAAVIELRIPEALIHNDPNLGNFLLSDHGVVLTDWAEAGVGFPFVTLHHLLAQASAVDIIGSWHTDLIRVYSEIWSDLLTQTQIAMALSLCPPLAIASYLCGRDSAFEQTYRQIDAVQSHSRTLAREMARLAKRPAFRRAIC